MFRFNNDDQRTMEEFRDYLRQIPMTEGTIDDYVSHIRKVLEERNVNSLAELDDQKLDGLINAYHADRKANALKKLKSFLLKSDSVRDIVEQITSGAAPEDLERLLRDEEEVLWTFTPLKYHKRDLEYGGRPLSPRIVFEHRRVVFMTDWLKETVRFIKECLGKSYGLDRLDQMIKKALEPNDNMSDVPFRDSELGEFLHGLLNHIIESEGDYPDRNKLAEARRRLRDLRSGPTRLVSVPWGTYLDHGIKGGHVGTITLYLANILDGARRHNLDPLDCTASVYAHEFFHFFHYACTYKEMSIYRKEKLPDGFDAYFPGKILKESLADYFQWHFTKERLPSDPAQYSSLPDFVKRPWSDYSVRVWPYSGAAKIINEEHLEDLFQETINFGGDSDFLYQAAFHLLAD